MQLGLLLQLYAEPELPMFGNCGESRLVRSTAEPIRKDLRPVGTGRSVPSGARAHRTARLVEFLR